jgi:hypothetical protein
MRKIIEGKVYDTATAELLLHDDWHSHHPNQGGGGPRLYHERAIYKTKKGKLFAYIYDETGYGRNRDGVTGLFARREEEITPLGGAADAVALCEVWNCFEAGAIEKYFAEGLEEA